MIPLVTLVMATAFANTTTIGDRPTLKKPAPEPEKCWDGKDNDQDGQIDDEDSDCQDPELDKDGNPTWEKNDPRWQSWSGQRAPSPEFTETHTSGSSVIPDLGEYFAIETASGTLWVVRSEALQYGTIAIAADEEQASAAFETGTADIVASFHVDPVAMEGHEVHVFTEPLSHGVQHVLYDATTDQMWIAGPGESVRVLDQRAF
jgi:hypothetical protein